MKIYTLVDGSVQMVKEELVGSFEEFERAWTLNRQPVVFSLK